MMIRDKTDFRISVPSDVMGILSVTEYAFQRKAEVELVRLLLQSETETRSFVAVLDGMIIGHVLFSKLDGPDDCLGLGPLSVHPDWRDFLVGTQLVSTALAQLRSEKWKSIFVLGDPIYYGRFGFRRELASGVTSQYQGPYLLATELVDGALRNYSGSLTYPAPFSSLAP